MCVADYPALATVCTQNSLLHTARVLNPELMVQNPDVFFNNRLFAINNIREGKG